MDVTEHPIPEAKLNCCSLKDLFSNRIVGYSIGPRMTSELAYSSLRSPVARRQPHGTVVVHPDWGAGSSALGLPSAAQGGGAHRSDGPGGSGWRQRSVESFHSLLQKNVLNRLALGEAQRTQSSPGSSAPTTVGVVSVRLAG